MATNLIDGQHLLDGLHKKLLLEAGRDPKLDAGLKQLLKLRQETHDMISLAITFPPEIRDRFLEEAGELNIKHFWEYATSGHVSLSPHLQEIVNLEKVVREQIQATEESVLESSVEQKPKRVRRNHHRKEKPEALLTETDRAFEEVKPELIKVLQEIASHDQKVGDLRVANKTDLEWIYMVKFNPFVELSRMTGFTPEEWMDCDEVRAVCADWLVETYGYNKLSAAAFYGHVTEKLRGRENSMWNDYKARLAVDSVDSK